MALAWVLAAAASAGGAGTAAAAAPEPYIVVFRAGVQPGPATRALERRHAFRAGFRYEHALRGFSATLSPGQRAAVAADARVLTVAPDTHVEPTALDKLLPGEALPTGVRRMGAVLAAPRRGTPDVRRASNVAVAVIDTGVDLDHPDLNVVDGTDCTSPGTSAEDDNGHGTHVAGTIAAKNNGSGVVGVVPGTTVVAVKGLRGSGSTPLSVVICGIDWVTANAASLNIKVANMSLGGPGSATGTCGATADVFRIAICGSIAAGVTYVVAAGNETDNIASHVPAAYPEVLTVTSMSDKDGLAGGTGGSISCPNSTTLNADDSASDFSNYATSAAVAAHTVAAPGKCILSTWLGNAYLTISGTSMASPHVAGLVALCYGDALHAGPCTGMTPAQVLARIKADAVAGPPGYGFTSLPGRLYGELVRAGVFR
jgi:subtilisin